MNLLRAHGSPTNYQYQHGCRCVACKGAQSAYDAAYNAAHKDEKAARAAAYYDANRDAILEEFAEFHEWLQVLRTNNGCEDCGTHGGRMEHHHVDPATKMCQISEMCNHSLDALEEELEKCVVGCVPCHNKRHVAMRHEGKVPA